MIGASTIVPSNESTPCPAASASSAAARSALARATYTSLGGGDQIIGKVCTPKRVRSYEQSHRPGQTDTWTDICEDVSSRSLHELRCGVLQIEHPDVCTGPRKLLDEIDSQRRPKQHAPCSHVATVVRVECPVRLSARSTTLDHLRFAATLLKWSSHRCTAAKRVS